MKLSDLLHKSPTVIERKYFYFKHLLRAHVQSPTLDSTGDHIITKSDTQSLPSMTGGSIRFLCKKRQKQEIKGCKTAKEGVIEIRAAQCKCYGVQSRKREPGRGNWGRLLYVWN